METISRTPVDVLAIATPRRGVAATLALGIVGGFALGVLARAWMRLISDDPEFSWSGTIFIVAAFTIFGLTQSIAAATWPRARRRWTLRVARVAAIVGMMPLFAGAGAIMMPTVVLGGLASARVGWPRLVRWGFGTLAAIPAAYVAGEIWTDFGVSLRTVAGLVGFAGIYAIVVRSTRYAFTAQPGSRQAPRWFLVGVLVAITAFVVFSIVGMTGG